MIRLALRVRREDAELALAELLELAPSGVEERDEGEIVEYAVYGAPGELPALPDLRAAAGGALVEITTEEVPDDWDERWKAFHRPVLVREGARAVRVRPPWEPASPAPGVEELVIDPGQAFGTGAHDTTRLCLELLLGLEPRGACVDLGCGSGVLAIAAARLGWTPVLGVDHEPESVAATRANAHTNGVAVEARAFDLLRDGPAPGAPSVLANLLRPLLLALARTGFAGEAPATLVASGLLAREADEVAAAFAAGQGLREAGRRRAGEWAALLLVR
ncbi:MAG TPA: 50S ribosomal protein L11 methyltransferase [Solirubrobacteraceae bacterium]|nr:50S ribosomal protein L11 methyltransferase [Solirubrobacteraceae bacterium]